MTFWGSEMRKRRYRVALAGYYGFGNLGDELLGRASIEALLRCGVAREEIVVLSASPEDRAFGVETVSRWSFLDVARTLARSDTLLLGGGGLFQDVTSLRSCFWYWGLTRLARLCGAVPWALSQSVGPLNRRVASSLTRNALRACRLLQVRDERSLALCGRLGVSAILGDDLVFSLAEPFAEELRRFSAEREPTRLLVNLRPHPDIERFVAAAQEAARDFTGEIVGVAVSRVDEALMRRLVKQGKFRCDRVERVADLGDVARLVSGAAAGVGMRLHFLILLALAGVPLAALPYDPKVEAFAEHSGLRVWRGGPVPSFRAPLLPDLRRVRDDLDLLCRRALEIG